ncbi:MAG TPA: DUF305 domain-containing protein [Gemmatimonadetes bacterium]|nr:DUF305 domain-containing protein [Gemmatimonadota bacterium]
MGGEMRVRASRHRCTVATLLVVLVSSACGGASAGLGTSPSPGTTSIADLEALYRARTDSARMRFTDADVRFMTGMIGHHAQALVMAGFAPTHDAGPSVDILTARTINAQRDEIVVMQQWLRDRGQAVPEVYTDGDDSGVRVPQARMPGMLTPQQMRELDAARGPDFDRLFLVYMIQHHGGAVTMVDDLFATDGAALDDVVFKVASDIQVDQRTEIARMERMLEGMPSAGRRR